MNLIKCILSGLGLVLDREVIQEKPFICWNIPSFCVKAMAAVVMLPCAVELALAKPIKMVSEDSGSFVVPLESFDKDVTDIVGSVRALEFCDFRGESGDKFLRNDSKSISLSNVDSDSSADKASKNSGFWSSNGHNDLWSAIGIIPSLWLMFWAANLNRPNV